MTSLGLAHFIAFAAYRVRFRRFYDKQWDRLNGMARRDAIMAKREKERNDSNVRMHRSSHFSNPG